MTPNKVRKLCSGFGDIEKVETFSRLEGICVEEVGVFRKAGRKSVSAAKGAASIAATTTNNIDNSTDNSTNNTNSTNNNTNNNNCHNTNNIDNSVTNNTIHLHVHAFGQEDVSGITLEAFKEMMSNKEDMLTSMKTKLPDLCEYIASREWEKVEQRLYLQHRKALNPHIYDEESDSENDLGEGGIFIPKEMRIGGELATFEKVENDEAYAEEPRELVEEITLLQEEAKYRSLGTPPDMAELLYQDPQNCNIMATTKDGNMSYYDGKRWQKIRVDNMTEVLENWEKKFAECVKMLEQREGEAMTKSFQGQYSEEIISNFEKDLVIEPKTFKRLKALRKRSALLALENMNARFKEVREATGKKVKRGSESDADAKKQKYVKAATWAKLVEM